MYCRNCGRENKQEDIFCRWCGARQAGTAAVIQRAEPAAAGPKKKRGKKALWIVLIVVILAAAAVLTGLFFYHRRDRYYYDGSWMVARNGDAFVTVHNGRVIREENDYGGFSSCLDGNVVTFTEGDELYIIKGKEKERIAKNVSDSRLAHSGKAVVYEREGTLYYYNCRAKESEKIAKETVDYEVSHDGKYVAYTTEESLHLWNGTDSERLAYGEDLNLCIWSVGDDGLVYALNVEDEDNETGTLYSFTNSGEMTTVGTDVSTYYPMSNRAGTQMLFFIEDACYVSVDGSKAKALDICAEYGLEVVTAGTSYYTADVKDLREQIYWTAGSERMLIRLDEDWDVDVILDNLSWATRAYDNSGLYAKDEEGTLYEIDQRTGEKEKLAENISMGSAAGLGVFYFTDEDGALYRNSKDNKIADGMASYGFVGRDDGGILYIDEDGDLYRAGILGKAKKIDDEVREVWRSGKHFVYLKENEEDPEWCNIYFSKHGNKFEKIDGAMTGTPSY